ncbi:hypothetical protein [Alkalihalobacillus sp. TS-13]|uniref:hypothetical protein n=1 Tax=Alkalihalobacillus sp. TS-13 TaxID=2842455 RepID=UPI001C8846BE|nr:hypothetical protein [Alkalihalobacillus sp. TS-13]
MKGRVIVDLSNGSATIINDNGKHEGTFSGVTRRGTEAAITRDGWRFVPGSKWALTSPPDGFWRKVVKE